LYHFELAVNVNVTTAQEITYNQLLLIPLSASLSISAIPVTYLCC